MCVNCVFVWLFFVWFFVGLFVCRFVKASFGHIVMTCGWIEHILRQLASVVRSLGVRLSIHNLCSGRDLGPH